MGNIPKQIFYSGIYGLLGLGSRLAESIYRSQSSPYYNNPNATFPTIYEQLELNGYTSRKAFSMWLNDINAATGSILFGGIDTTKYKGELRSVPVLLTPPDNLFSGWAVHLSSLAYIDASNSTLQLLPANSSGLNVILDSGSPNTYLPTAIADSVATRLDATTQQNFTYVSCSLRQDQSQSLDFSFGGSPGPKIKVPVSELIYPYGAPSNIGNVTAEDGTELCYLGLIGNPGPLAILGDTFIRSAYIVYDVDNLQVSMAPAVYGAELEGNLVEL